VIAALKVEHVMLIINRFELENPDYMPPSHVREARLFKQAAMFAFKEQIQGLKGKP
jgi:hypothetical protein